MDYAKHYTRLIEQAQQQEQTGYTEQHHITPRCLGGSDEVNNLVRLTPEEHYVAHQLLVKMYSDNEKLVYALNKMTQGRASNKRYGWVKRRWQEVCKKRTGEKNGSFGKSWYYNPETGESGKFAEAPEGWEPGRRGNNSCLECGEDTGSRKARYCSQSCRNKAPKEDRRYANGFQCEVDGITFSSISQAADSLNVEHETARMRFKSQSWISWKVLTGSRP